MPEFNYEQFAADLKAKGTIPLIVIHAKPESDGSTTLDFERTKAYEYADDQLRSDIKIVLDQAKQ